MKIETSDIYRAIRRTLERYFPEIKVQIKDIKNPAPPCFYIKFIGNTTIQTALEFENNTCSFDIIYFSNIETLQDLLSVEKTLKSIFKKPLKVELLNGITQYQEIDSISINTNENDYILNCTISLSIDQLCNDDENENRYDEYENDEMLEELDITI